MGPPDSAKPTEASEASAQADLKLQGSCSMETDLPWTLSSTTPPPLLSAEETQAHSVSPGAAASEEGLGAS